MLGLSLCLPQFREEALAQDPTPSVVKNALVAALPHISFALTSAHVGVTVLEELCPAFGSGVLVKPPEKMAKFLQSDELLVVSASHNFANWNEASKVFCTLFSPSEKKGLGETLERVTYEGRLIGRFVNAEKNRSMSTCRSVSVDVAFLALTKMPPDQVAAAKERALPLATEADAFPRVGTTIYAAGSPGVEPHPSGKGFIVAKPKIGRGIVLNPSTRAGMPRLVTQYGEVFDHYISTNEQCIVGESGGGLFTVNEKTGQLEVIGVCSSGGDTNPGPLGWIDFPPGPAGVTDDEIARYGLERAVLRRIPEAKSPHRGNFTGVISIIDLVNVLDERYRATVEQLQRLDALYEQCRQDFARAGAKAEKLQLLYELHVKGREHLVKELNTFIPNHPLVPAN